VEKFQHALPAHSGVEGTDLPDSELIVLILPALGTPTRLYQRLYEGLLQAGFSAAIMSLRGDGSLGKVQLVSEGNFGYVEVLKDIDAIIAFINHKYPDKDIVTMGHSFGGQLGCLYACHKTPRVLASVVIAGGNVDYRSWTGVERLKTFWATQFFGMVSRLLGWFPGKWIGFGGNQPRNLMVDWSRNARTGVYRLINQTIDYEGVSKVVSSFFLGVVIPNDFFAPYASTKSLLDKFSSSDREMICISQSCFKTVVPDHFSWLKEPGPAIDAFVSWVGDKGLGQMNAGPGK